MEIQKTSAISSISSNANKPAEDISNLQPGASLNAVVAGKSDDNTFILKLSDGRLIRAQTLSELALGQMLKLEVVKSGDVPELKIVWPEHFVQTPQISLQNALRQLLPKQIDLKDFAIALKQAASLSPGKTSLFSAAIQATLGSLSSKEDLMTAEGVKQSIANSGVFLEAKLAHQLSPNGDMKGQLLVLAGILQKASIGQGDTQGTVEAYSNTRTAEQTQTLLSKTDGAIARIVLDQLASLPQNNDAPTTWRISIPFTDGSHTEMVGLKIKREDNHNPAQQQGNWSVVLELNPPGLGPLHCKISLIADKVDTYFWSDSDTGMLQVQENLDLLARRYAEVGLATGYLNVVDGARMRAESNEKLSLPSLLDELA